MRGLDPRILQKRRVDSIRWIAGSSPAMTNVAASSQLEKALVERDNLNPIRPLAGRVASDRLQGAAFRVDRVRRDGVRLLAGYDDEAAGRIDGEAARLFLSRRAAEIRELSACGIDAERAERARGALGS